MGVISYMKISLITLLILLLHGNALFAQKFIFPALTKQGKILNDLVPPRWMIIDSAKGDLNHDGVADLAVILEFHAAVNEKRAYGDNTTDLITELQKPRILAVYFKNKNSAGYTLSMQNNDFILRSEEGGMLGDPLEELSISSNTMKLGFAGGGNSRWVINYTFRYQNKDWYLTEANTVSHHRVSGEMTERNYNFLTKKMKVTEGNAFSDTAKDKPTFYDLKIDRMRTFNTFKKPWTWQIAEDEFL